jgi:hypothetical protein
MFRVLLYGIISGLATANILEFDSSDYNGVWRILYNGVTYELRLRAA